MKTKRIYFEDTYQFNEPCKIIDSGKDENGFYVILDRTIFHPQGGGQPSDQGELTTSEESLPIIKVKTIDQEIRHYTPKDCRSIVGQDIEARIVPEMRLLHAKLHTGGHVISHVVEKLYPSWKAAKGHHFPDSSYVEFHPLNEDPVEVDASKIQHGLEALIQKEANVETTEVPSKDLLEYCPDLEYNSETMGTIRLSKIGDFPYSPCGGTHVASLKELLGLVIQKAKLKKGILKVYYH